MMYTRVVVVSRETGPAAYVVERSDVPSPGSGEVRIRVEAAGVSLGDVFFQRGAVPGGPHPPYVPGCDVVGVVEEVGSGVIGLAPGMRVAALVATGGFASAAVVPARFLVAVPDVDPTRVAAVLLNGFIARQMAHRVARVRSGSRVLVHGASGGVGLALLQTIRQIDDVVVWGTASAAHAELLRANGARPIDYRHDDVVGVVRAGGAELDAVFDPIGGASFRRSVALLRRGGTLVAYGQSDALRDDGRVRRVAGAVGFLRGILLPKLVPDGKRTVFYDAFASRTRSLAAYRHDLEAVLADLVEGRIAPRSIEVRPLTDAPGALEAVESGGGGKVVLDCRSVRVG